MTRDEVATTWRELVLKHTKGGACNFQDAAHELAEIVQTALKAALAEPVQEPVDFVFLLREADEIVRGKPTWKRFIDGTPLSNDIAVWMTVFAQDVARRAALRSALAKPPTDWEAVAADQAMTIALMKSEPVQEPVNYTTGHCKNRKQKGGCQLHNLQCGWPDCDRRPTHPLQRTKTNQCGETCERAKLCPACLTAL